METSISLASNRIHSDELEDHTAATGFTISEPPIRTISQSNLRKLKRRKDKRIQRKGKRTISAKRKTPGRGKLAVNMKEDDKTDSKTIAAAEEPTSLPDKDTESKDEVYRETARLRVIQTAMQQLKVDKFLLFALTASESDILQAESIDNAKSFKEGRTPKTRKHRTTGDTEKEPDCHVEEISVCDLDARTTPAVPSTMRSTSPFARIPGLVTVPPSSSPPPPTPFIPQYRLLPSPPHQSVPETTSAASSQDCLVPGKTTISANTYTSSPDFFQDCKSSFSKQEVSDKGEENTSESPRSQDQHLEVER